MSKFLSTMKKELSQTDGGTFFLAEWKDGRIETEALVKTNPCQNIYSVAKAYVVTAIGLLADRGLIRTDEILTDILNDEIPKDTNKVWYSTTVDMLLRHRVGLPTGFLDIDCCDSRNFGEDYLAYTLRAPIAEDYTPDRYAYTDAAYYILSRIVEKRAGMPLDDFLWKQLFYPTGCREAAWSHCPQGHAIGATGLYIRAAELVKLGSIYLTGGLYGNQRILSEEWVKTTLERGYELKSKCGGKAYGKGGMRGQMLLILPDQGRAFAWLGYGSYDLSEAAASYSE